MSPSPLLRLATTALLCVATAGPSLAGSSTSSASSAGSQSVGSLSASIEGSSNASSGNKTVADGDYRIVDVAEAPRPGVLRLKLQPAASDAEVDAFFLLVPAPTVAAQSLTTGDLVSARQRPYGVEFARTDTRETFFLVLADDWYRELDPRAVTL